MFIKKQIKKLSLLLITLSVAMTANAIPTKSYPGKFKSTVANIEAANIIHVNSAVWPGYPRLFRITLPSIKVPQSFATAPACQNELAEKALNFTKEFLSNAKSIEVRDIYMESTGKIDGLSDIYTNNGTLVKSLKQEGLARSADIEESTPWCEE